MSKGRKGKRVKTGGRNLLGRRQYTPNEVVPTKGLMAKSIQPTKQPLGTTTRGDLGSDARSPFKPSLSGERAAKLAGMR